MIRKFSYVLGSIVSALVFDVFAGSLVIDKKSQWQEWEYPQGVLDLQEDGSVSMQEFRRDIDAVANASDFVHPNAKGQEVRGGISNVGTNPNTSVNIIDGDPQTWWQPDHDDPLADWWIEVDLGRMVQAKSIRLIFPDQADAKPLSEFTIYASEGARQVIGKDVFRFNKVGGTTQPNTEIERTFLLQTIEAGKGEGEYLRTAVNDTLGYLALQHIRIIVHSKNEAAALADIEVQSLGENIALATVKRGGSIRTGHDVQNITGIFDGSATKWWTADGRAKVDWRESGMWFEWDLGASFWIDQVNMLEFPAGFATTGHSNTYQYLFELQTSDGSPIPTRGDDTIQGPYDYQKLTYLDNIVGGNPRTIKFDFRFPERPVRYLFYHHEAPWGFGFRIFEIFLYGAGFPAEIVMKSDFIDLQGTKSLRNIQWDADLPQGTRVDIRSRTGDFLQEEIFYYNKNGEEIPPKLWNKLPKSQKLPLVTINKPGTDWSTWSSVYKFSGETFLSPSPRNFVQLEVRLITDDPKVAPVLRSVSLDFDAPLISGGVLARISPQEAVLDSLTQFRLLLNSQAGIQDQGFDRLILRLPGRLDGDVLLKLGEDEVLEPDAIRQIADSLIIDLPTRVRKDSLEVLLPLRIVKDASLIEGWISAQAKPDVNQGVRPVGLTALTVFVPEISAKDNLLRRINLSGNVLTPNEDGINDKIEVDLLVVKTSTEPEVTIYDLAGRQVAKAYIVNDEKYQWDGRDIGGMLLPPGSYILEVKVAADVRTDVQQRIINLVY